MKKYLEALIGNPLYVPFTVVDKPSQRKIGIVTYLNIVPKNRTLEIGGIWYWLLWHFVHVAEGTSQSFTEHTPTQRALIFSSSTQLKIWHTEGWSGSAVPFLT
jgi:hypothetical protein